MFPSFIGILDIQSWWEVPSIAYFCSLFRTAFNLLDFDIEELEEALLTDGTEESASSLLTELIVRLLNGCLGNNDISAFNYQMYLRRLFRRKCQETGRYNPFNTDIDFQFLPLRTKVEILYALCDFRLDANDIFDLFKNLEAESLRVEPLGWDDNDSAYWYFYGTRLYREDIIKKPKVKNKKKKGKESKKRGWFYGDDWLDDEETERVWQVVCFTEEDWTHLTEKFSKATSKVEKELYRSLSQNFLPEIPRLFQEKERLQRKRLLELAPRRTSSRVLQKIKQKEEEDKPSDVESKEQTDEDKSDQARENRAKRRNLIRSKSESSDTSDSSSDKEMPQKATKRPKGQDKRSKNSSTSHKGEPPPEQPVKTGRKTNNSLANATGQIVIPDTEEPANSTRKKLKTSQIFSQTEEDVQTDMYKVLEQLTAHEDAWPFMDPVEEEYAPNYYAVIRRPMDLHKMEERLDTGYYTDFSMFKADFKLIVNNCRLYNGQDNEYTMMVDNLQVAFDRLTEKYIHRLSSSDEEIAVEFQLPTPSRKHKLKTSESPTNLKRKKRKSHSDGGEGKSSHHEEEDEPATESPPAKDNKESHHKSKDGKLKKKRKGHHRHGKHSKNHKKDSHHKSVHGSKSSKHSKKQKHGKDKETKRSKKKTKKTKPVVEPDPALVRSASKESLESSSRSRSASPLPSIHTPTPSPEPNPAPADPLTDPDFFKDKYDKIKERRRHAAKDAWESLFDYKQNKQKQNLHIPEKDKNQKLRETIEKLKAKNEKYKDGSLFKNLFSAGKSSDKNSDTTSTTKESSSKDHDDSDFTDEESKELPPKEKHKPDGKKTTKKHTSARNESASEALEQAVKDISKWLDDAPKGSSTSSPCDSPAQTISTEEQDNSRQDDEFLQDKSLLSRKEMARKRPSSREPKIVKRREIQRTIDRLQPGKSKGNLITTKKDLEKIEEIAPIGTSLLNKAREASKTDESSPKLSLGSVLATVEFTLGNDHNFDKRDEPKPETKKANVTIDTAEKDAPKDEKPTTETKKVDAAVETMKEDQIVEPEPTLMKPSQEKATPNLSAWFKAFGTPKSTPTMTTVKKKSEEEHEEKPAENPKEENKASSPKHPAKYDSPTEVESGIPEGGDSPLPAVTATPRARRISTGSSVSERSSFSQDLDSPRHQISHTSPLLRSPASPRTDDFQKITYPIINGTVRAGFYQDTTSVKSSPEKSCSPREGPQSPYSPYSQHVYASNNAMGSSTPNYFADHNKSPLPTYGQNQPPPYYDTTKAAVVPKPRVHEDYTALGPDSFQQSNLGGPQSPFSQSQPASYSQPQLSPAPLPPPPSPAPSLPVSPATQLIPDPKTALFPVKKRTYNEADSAVKKTPEIKENPTPQNKNDYQKMVQSIQTMSSVDDIAVALTEKSELSKINSLRDKSAVEYMDRLSMDNRDAPVYDKTEHSTIKKESTVPEPNKSVGMSKNDNIDMVNMGYMNPDSERRSSGDHEINFNAREGAMKSNMNPQPKGYEIDAIAMNLGLSNHNAQKSVTKPSLNSGAIPPAHSQERSAADLLTVQNHHMMQQHAEYAESIAASSQSASNFSLNDIELANKKLYSCSTPSNTALDYGNWKMTNQIRKQDVLPSDYAAFNANAEKLKSDVNTANAAALNYNKNLQQQQFHNYNAPRTTLQNLPSELRIPNPRGYMKNDHMSVVSSHSSSEITSKNIDTTAKTQKSEKIIQNHPLVGSLQYKTPYSTHSSLPLDSLRNIPNIPQMLERYTNDERYLSSFATASGSSLYHDKSFQMAQMSQMFNKSIASEVHTASTSVSAYSQPSTTMSKETSIYKTSPNLQSASVDSKSKTKRKRTSETKQPQQVMGTQSFHTSSCTSDVLSSVKSGMVPGSAFNFGATSNMALGGGLYGDNSGFSIEDLRNSTANQLMAANYMAAAAAARQPAGTDTPPRQPAGAFPWASSSGTRGAAASYASSPLYQQYLQRHQEELLRQTGAQIMGLYPPGYPAALAARQPYDRPSWL